MASTFGQHLCLNSTHLDKSVGTQRLLKEKPKMFSEKKKNIRTKAIINTNSKNMNK